MIRAVKIRFIRVIRVQLTRPFIKDEGRADHTMVKDLRGDSARPRGRVKEVGTLS